MSELRGLGTVPNMYKQTSSYGFSLYCTSQILGFLQIEGLQQPCVEQVHRRHFSISSGSLCISVSHFGNSCTISKFFIIIFVTMTCQSVIFDATIVIVLDKCCVCSDCSMHQPLPHLSPSLQASLVPETQQY